MSRWYDQHRVDKRLRRLERAQREHAEAFGNMVDDLMDDMRVANPDGKIAVAFEIADVLARRGASPDEVLAVADALDARERPPAFRSDDGSSSLGAAQHE